MNEYFKKIKHIMPAYWLSIAIGLVMISDLRWICLESHVFENDMIWEILIPIISSLLLVLLFLRFRFKPIKYPNPKSEGLLELFSGVSIALILILSQHYFTNATGELKTIDKIDDIEKHNYYRYYKIKNFAVSEQANEFYIIQKKKTKRSSPAISIYFVKPIVNKPGDKVELTQKYWYGLKFRKKLRSNLFQATKDSLCNAFYKECSIKVNRYNYHALDHFERQPNYNDRSEYLQAICKFSYKQANRNIIILEPINESRKEINNLKLWYFCLAFLAGTLLMLLLLIAPRYQSHDQTPKN